MSDPVGLAQVGVGYWGKNLLRNFTKLREARVLAVFDHEAKVRDEIGREYPQLFQAQNYDEMLAISGVEAVVIATDTPHHFVLAKRALEEGKHVF
ncbi:MAG TPA: Gfo/Idh/MocA family oxidoreductase, partial [Rhodothermales bacterium]